MLACAPPNKTDTAPLPARDSAPRGLDEFAQQEVFKRLTDLDFRAQLGNEMIVRKVLYSGADQMIIPAYLFAPRDTMTKHPALIMVHGGVHGDFETLYVPKVRSLVARGYVVIAPEYRGSTGYGKDHYDAIDYGGKEVADVPPPATTWLRWCRSPTCSGSASSVGVTAGSSRCTRSSRHPNTSASPWPTYRCPICPHGCARTARATARSSPTEGIRRHARAESDRVRSALPDRARARAEDAAPSCTRRTTIRMCSIIENHNLRDSMVVAGMDKAGLYHYREWHNPPGGHEFSRVDSPQAKESWDESMAFLDKYLKGPDQ